MMAVAAVLLMGDNSVSDGDDSVSDGDDCGGGGGGDG